MDKVVLIGLDGAPFSLIQKWANEGALPNLQKLINNGAFGPLISTYLPETPIAWTSIVTGKNAGKHGIFDWGERRDNSYEIEVTISTSCKEPKLWDIISKAGKKVGVFNVPITYPPKEVNGFLVSGFDTPSIKSCFTYPPSLKDEIFTKVKDYILAVQESYTFGLEEKYISGLIFSIEKKEELALYLIDYYPTDFSIYVFMELDHLHHKLWRLIEKGSEKEKNLFLKVYQRMDETVGKIISRFDAETNILLISDHGAGPLEGIMFINKWLMDHGWLKLKKGPTLLLKYLMSKIDIIPKVYRIVSKVGLGKLKKYLSPALQHNLATSFISFKDIDWENTKAFAYGEYGQIFINLKGREPKGIVTPGEEYEHLLKEITHELLEVAHPKTGEKMIKKVYRKEELYHGPMLKKAPDLTFSIGDLRYDSSVKFGLGMKEVFGPPEFEDSGTHRREGIFIASGKLIEKGYKIKKVQLVDIAPTVLYLLGIPIPMDMDGKVLINIFKENLINKHPVKYMEVKSENILSEKDEKLTQNEAEMVKRRLKSLGYLE